MRAPRLQAIATAPGALAWVRAGRASRVLHVFAAVCNLIDDRQDLLTLMLEPGQMDSFTLLLKAPPAFAGFVEHVDTESIVTCAPGQIRIGDLEIVVDAPQEWISRPDWSSLGIGLRSDSAWIDLIEGALIRRRSFESLAALIGNPNANWQGSRMPWWAKAGEPIQSLLKGVTSRDTRILAEAAAQLAGLGPGLTPGGDDCLMGMMYAARLMLEPDEAETACETIVRTSTPHTGLFPAAHIKAAGRGEASNLWHELLAACLEGEGEEIRSALDRLLAIGHTSGEDAVTGFLLGLKSWKP